MIKTKLLTTASGVLVATALAGAALAGPASTDVRVQGGMGAGGNAIGPVAGPSLTAEQRRLMRQVRALRAETQDVMKRNGGALPEAERVALQSRFDTLKAALQRAG